VTHRVAYSKQQYLPFEEARGHVRSLQLKSQAEWKSYCKSGKKPQSIPARPEITYAWAGWVSLLDWLGTGNGRKKKKQLA
jgi:hypothetical protein